MSNLDQQQHQPQPRIEPILVLYGSQTGNSEQAAKDVCQQMSEKLCPSELVRLTGCNAEDVANIRIEPMHMQLDDFIELYQCKWTRIFVIVVSSYGIGQAPLGSYRFRELCDIFVDDTNDIVCVPRTNLPLLLAGTYFAMCGLGDSKYRTFFNNPTIIDQGLRTVGAERLGPLGKADASGTGIDEQSVVIDRWISNLWQDLAVAIVNKPLLSEEQLHTMQQTTFKLCAEINPDLAAKLRKEKECTVASTNSFWSITLIVLAVAIIISAVTPFFLLHYEINAYFPAEYQHTTASTV